jgi:hypothetical protein
MFSRKLSGSGAPQDIAGNVGSLLNEIASAPQQRRLTAVIGDTRIILDVSNRELMRIVSVTPDSLPHADAVSIAARDDDKLSDQLNKLGGFFSAITCLDGEMTLASVPAPLRYSTKLQGFSKDELKNATRVAVDRGAGLPKAVPQAKEPVAPEAVKSEATETAATEPTAAGATAAGEEATVTPAPAVDQPKAIPVQAAPAAPDIDVTPAVKASAEVAAAGPVGPDTRFFDQLAAKCEAGMVLEWDGATLHRAGKWEMLDGIVKSLIQDMAQWRRNTEKTLPLRQLLMWRGRLASDLILCVLLDKSLVTIVALPASSTGRAFSAAACVGV